MENIAIVTIFVYFIFSLLYFIIKYFKIDIKNEGETSFKWNIAFILFSFFIIYLQNIYYSSINIETGETCVINNNYVLLSTFIPILLILFPIILLVEVFKWNNIFGNTIGASILENIKFETYNQDIFYKNPNLYLQTLSMDDIIHKDRLEQILSSFVGHKVNVTNENHKIIIQQHKTRKLIGNFIWFTLTGIVASLVSLNTVLLQDCAI